MTHLPKLNDDAPIHVYDTDAQGSLRHHNSLFNQEWKQDELAKLSRPSQLFVEYVWCNTIEEIDQQRFLPLPPRTTRRRIMTGLGLDCDADGDLTMIEFNEIH